MHFLEFDEMTRFERARIISARALQIAMGAPTLVDTGSTTDPIDMARAEFEEDAVPLTVRAKKPPEMD